MTITKKLRLSLMLVFVLAFIAAGWITCLPAAAADTEVIFEEDPEDSKKGHVIIRAVVEKGYESDIGVDLIGSFEGGNVHRYTLASENHYGISDDVAVGSYICVPFISESGDSGTSEVFVEYGGEEKEVTGDKTAVFLVVSGSSGFVNDYLWLSEFRTDDGEPIKGVITKEQAQELFASTIAMQDRTELETEERPSEIEGPEAMTSAQATTQVLPKPETPERPVKQDTGRTAVLAGAIICVLIATCIAVFKR